MTTFQPSVHSNPHLPAHARNNLNIRPEVERRARIGMAVWGVAVPLAWALSYTRNQSIGWAFLSGVVAVPYILFRGFEYALTKGK